MNGLKTLDITGSSDSRIAVVVKNLSEHVSLK